MSTTKCVAPTRFKTRPPQPKMAEYKVSLKQKQIMCPYISEPFIKAIKHKILTIIKKQNVPKGRDRLR